MLKSRIGLLVTLVLALVATAVFSTLSPASVFPGRDGSVAAAGTGGVKPRPVALTGDPDAPQGPPPPVTLSGGGLMSPSLGDATPAGWELTGPPWWISWILAMLQWSTVH